jgi:hypothetical protein
MPSTHRFILSIFAMACVHILPLSPASGADQPWFHIQVVDEATGRGIPLVELETVNSVIHITDNAGNIAFQEPGLMNQTVYFHVRSHGYDYPKDGFGFRGAKLKVTAGGKATVKLKRINLAERLYRITGGGQYRDSVLLGQTVPIKEPVLNAQVVGSDSVINAILNGKLHWFWGDTNRASYPLGNFQVPGATSQLPSDGGLDPSIGINLNYFQDSEGFAKQTAKMPGDGPTWIFGTGIVKGSSGSDELWTGYMKVEPPLKVYARGVAKFNETKAEFERVLEFPKIPTLFPEGQTLAYRDGSIDYLYFCQPYPHVRVRATPEAYRDPEQYEAFTCLKPGSKVENLEVERDARTHIRYAWKRNTAAVGPAEQKKLLASGELKPEEALLRLRDRDTGKHVIGHTGSVNWNEFRQRWIMIMVEHYGSSLLGEVWYAEADSPLGPWEYAVKIMTHDKYSFYNPKQHPYFDQRGGQLIYFEGTYTQMFSGNPVPTPRYEYNQMLYRLDLADPRTALPVPVYLVDASSPFQTKSKNALPLPESMRFLALDRPGIGSIPIYSIPSEDSKTWSLTTQVTQTSKELTPVFHALPHDAKTPPQTATPLYEFTHQDGVRREYSIKPDRASEGFTRTKQPICLVWKP